MSFFPHENNHTFKNEFICTPLFASLITLINLAIND